MVKGLHENPDATTPIPFSGLSPQQVRLEVDKLMSTTGLHIWKEYFVKGAFLAQDPEAFETKRDDNLELLPQEREDLRLEKTRKGRQYWPLSILVGCLALGTLIHGWDETAANSAYVCHISGLQRVIGPTNNHIQLDRIKAQTDHRGILKIIGLVNGALYLCGAFSYLLIAPHNAFIGRRVVIFWISLISCFFYFAEIFSQNWKILFTVRSALAFGMGLMSATISIYEAECAPTHFGRILVRMWQVLTTFGIMCGYMAGVVIFQQTLGLDVHLLFIFDDHQTGFYTYLDLNRTPHPKFEKDFLPISKGTRNWRLMLASPIVFLCILAAYVYILPESPRWLLQKGRQTNDLKIYDAAFKALRKLRNSKLHAARDFITINHVLHNEDRVENQRAKDLSTVSWSRRVLTTSLGVSFWRIQVQTLYSATFPHAIIKPSPSDFMIFSMISFSIGTSVMTKYFDEKLMERFRLLYIFINMTWLITVLVFNQYSAFDSYTWYVFSGGLIPVYVSSSSSALSYLAEGRALEEFGRDFDKRSWEFAKAFDKGIQTLRGRRNVAKQTPRPEDSQVSLLPNEQKRITWICGCGDSMYTDVKELRSGAAHELQLALAQSSAKVKRASNYQQSESATPLSPSKINSVSHLSSESSSSSTANSLSKNAGATTNKVVADMPPARLHRDKSFLLLCVNTGKHQVELEHIDVSSIGHDQLLFQEIRQRYYGVRQCTRLSFFLPVSVSLVRFELVPLMSGSCIGILEPPSIPPAKEVEQKRYHYRPCPLDLTPPLPEDVFLHSFFSPGAHTLDFWLSRLPKKLNDRLHCSGSNGDDLSVGWGIHIVEGPNWLVLTCTFILVLAVSGIAAVVWSVTKGDVQGGMGIGAYLVTVQTAIMMAFFFWWQEK